MRGFRILNLDRALLKIFFTIAMFTKDLTDWYEYGVCAVDSLERQKHASLLMYRLFDWYEKSGCDNPAQESFTESTDRSICLALMIFMVYATEPNAAVFGPRLFKTVVKLRQSLQRVSLACWFNAPDLLFWVLTLRALGAKCSL